MPRAYLAPPWVQDERAGGRCRPRSAPLQQRRLGRPPSILVLPGRHSPDPALMDIVPKAGKRATSSRSAPTSGGGSTRSLSLPWAAPLPPRARGSAPRPGLELLSVVIPSGRPLAGDPRDERSLAFPLLGAGCRRPASARANGEDVRATRTSGIVFGVSSNRSSRSPTASSPGRWTAPDARNAVSPSPTCRDRLPLLGIQRRQPGHQRRGGAVRLRLRLLARVGESVRAGQVIGFLGDSDREPQPTVAPLDIPSHRRVGDRTSATDPAATELVDEPVGRTSASRSPPSTARRSMPTDRSSRLLFRQT